MTIRDCARAYGLELSVEQHQARPGEDWAEALVRGEADVLGENYWRLQRFAAAGAPFVTFASVAHVWADLLLVGPGIHSLDDLRGRKLAVRGTGPQALFPALFLRRLGLEDAVEAIVYPERETGRWRHWERVVDGTCDACFVVPIYAGAPLAAGLRAIPYPSFPFEAGHVTLTATEDVLQREREPLLQLLHAVCDATAEAESNPEHITACAAECRVALGAHHDLTTGAKIARIGELLAGEVGGPPLPTPTGLQNTLELARETYPDLAGFNPLRMWDFSLARDVLQERPGR